MDSNANQLSQAAETAAQAYQALRDEVSQRFHGQTEVIESCVCALLANGHVLLEGLPGLGKTTLMRALAEASGLEFQRIQFTPDLMPADILGARILDEDEHGKRSFRFEPGPIFSQIVLADEINRATPRTQAALLEAMQERQVTAYGEALTLGPPFFLVATQNPIEMEGTYPLPEAQLDRFLLAIQVNYPEQAELNSLLSEREEAPLKAVWQREQILQLQSWAQQLPTSSDMIEWVARILLATQPNHASAPDSVRQCIRYGASPRAGKALLACARARALMHGRLFVSDEDITALAPHALGHRLLFNYEGEASGISSTDIIAEVLRASSK